MNDFKNILRKYLKINNITQIDLSSILGESQQSVSDFLKKDGNVQNKTRKKYFEKLVGFEEFYKNETSEIQVYKSEGKIIKDYDQPSKEVYIIPVKGRAGLEQVYYDDIALSKLETENLTIKQPSSKGSKWFKIEVEGVSMDDSTNEFEGSKYSLSEGDWAYCRSIPKINWRDKLHINKVKIFCFFHNTRGIIFKKIKEHNYETGELLLSSLNSDKERFPDFKINVAECSYICNVIKVLSDF